MDIKELPQKFDEDFTRKALRDSLKRLQTDHLDMYGLHNPKLNHIRDNSIFDVLDSFVKDKSISTYQVALGPAIGWTQEGLESHGKTKCQCSSNSIQYFRTNTR